MMRRDSARPDPEDNMSVMTKDRQAEEPSVQVLDCARLARAKHAYTTRHVDTGAARLLLTEGQPALGDLVLAQVTAIGQHRMIELPTGRRAALFPGDEVVVAYGNRYAPDQFEALVPADLGPCHLAAAGGVAGLVEVSHNKMGPATSLQPIGLLADHRGTRINLHDQTPAGPTQRSGPRPVTIAVVGASMSAGKTTTAAHLVRGMRAAGLEVGAAKTTGTGAGGDLWLLQDAGAWPVYDFTSAGLPSTYLAGPDEVLRVFLELTDRLSAEGCEVIVLEVADGVYQTETAALLTDPAFGERVDALLFASSDALGASAGATWLHDRRLDPLALSGLLSSSPLATREAEEATGLQVWDMERLSDADAAAELVADLRAHRPLLGAAASPEPGPGPHDFGPELADPTSTGRGPIAAPSATSSAELRDLPVTA